MFVPTESNDTMEPKFQRSNLLVSKGTGLFSIKAFLFSNLEQVHTPLCISEPVLLKQELLVGSLRPEGSLGSTC